jgi:hypothetical protein
MTKYLTNVFRVEALESFVNKIANENSYVFAASVPVPETATDGKYPIQNDIFNNEYVVKDHIVFMKKINPIDIIQMVERYEWEENTVYSIYDDKDSDLENKNFFVFSREGDVYAVFKCIDNNANSTSTIQPFRSQVISADQLYKTSDDYVWKYMGDVPTIIYDKFKTIQYAPFVPNEDVKNTATSGAIDHIIVENAGNNYQYYVNGLIERRTVDGDSRKFYLRNDAGLLSSVNNFYVGAAIYMLNGQAIGELRNIIEYGSEDNNRYIIIDQEFDNQVEINDEFEIAPAVIVNGDGQGFKGRAIVNQLTKRIDRIEITNRGSGYTTAIASISSSTANSVGLQPATLRAVLSPRGGHGANQFRELNAFQACVSVDLVSNNLPVGTDIFNVFGIIESPIINELKIKVSNEDILFNGSIEIDDIITQEETDASGKVISIEESDDDINYILTLRELNDKAFKENIKILNTANTTVIEIITDIENIDNRTFLQGSLVFGVGFVKGETVSQVASRASGTVQEVVSNGIYLINVKGNFSTSPTDPVLGSISSSRLVINNIERPNLLPNTGDLYFVENSLPISRLENTSERIKIIIGF